MSSERSAIILAAGLGTRMKSSRPKVLHELLGRPLLGHVLKATKAIRSDRRVVVVGAAADQVTAYLEEHAPDTETVFQAEQLGTGNAVRIAMEALPDLTGTVVVSAGDVPLLRRETLERLVEAHEKDGNAATVLTAVVDDPTGLGRIVRDEAGNVLRNVEHRDADEAELAIREINSSIYAFDAEALREQLAKLNTANDQGEEYLTDVLELSREAGHAIGAFVVDDPTEVLGCNDRAQLAGLRRILRDRVNTELMRSGVTIEDPETTWIDSTAKVAPDVLIRPGCQLKGATAVDTGAEIGPDSTLNDTIVGQGPGWCAATPTRPRSARAPRSGRSRTCGPAPSSARVPRSAPTSRSRRPRSGPARRSRTCPTSATRPSAPRPTSRPGSSSPTTTASPNTTRPSARAPSSARTRS
ncbi:hypothetical protein GCM10029992_29170 [Glycomyces albus]